MKDDNGRELALGFKELIKNRVREWRTEHDDNARFRTADNVAMVKRQRGDYFGRFDEEWLQTNHQFSLVWKPGISRGFFTYPVIPRSIRAKIATEMATELKFTIEPAYKSPELEATCEKLEKIASYIRRINFDSQSNHDLSYLRQTGKCAFIYSFFDKDDGINVPVPNMSYRPFVQGVAKYDCPSCGYSVTPEEINSENPLDVVQQSLDTAFQTRTAIIQNGGQLPPDLAAHAQAAGQTPPDGQPPMMAPLTDSPAPMGATSETPAETPPDAAKAAGDLYLNHQIKESSEIVEDMSEEQCPNCGQIGTLVANHQFQINSALSPDGTIGYKNSGMLKTKIVSAMQMRIDEYNSLGFKIHNGHYLCHTLLMPLYEVLEMCGDDEDKKRKVREVSPDMWPQALHWHYELSKAAGNRSPYSNAQSNSYRNSLVPVEFWWVREVACGGDWKEPTGCEIGEFNIKKGETIKKAFERLYGKFNGLCVQMVGEEILKVWNDDFRKKWNGVPWKVDPHSGYPQGEENLLYIQDAATRIFTMVYSFAQRSSAPKGVANPLIFRRADLEANITGGWIFPKMDIAEQSLYENLEKHIFMLKGGDLPQSTQVLIDLVISITKETSGIYDETVGAANNTNETARGRETALNQSLSLQVPENRTKGDSFVEWFYTALEEIQTNADDVFYKLFCDDANEEWTQADLKAIRAINIRREVRIAVVNGTDMPQTNEDLMEGYLAAMEIGLFDPANPTPIDIKAELLKIRGIDYDLMDYEKTRRLAKLRYNRIKEIVSKFPAEEAVIMIPDPMQAAMQGGPAGPAGTPTNDEGTPPPIGQNGPAQPDPTQPLMLIPVLNPILEQQILSDPVTQIRDVIDNHFIYIQYYKEKMFGLLSKVPIDSIFVFAIQTMILQHRGLIAKGLAQQQAIQSVAGATDTAINNAPGIREEDEDRKDKSTGGPPSNGK